jgi:hypothetical protein
MIHRLRITFTAVLVLGIVIAWALYALFGYQLITAMHEGRSIGVLNEIIKGHTVHDIKHYFEIGKARLLLVSMLLLISVPFIVLGVTLYIKYIVALIACAICFCFIRLALDGYQFFIVALPIFSSYLVSSRLLKKDNFIDKLNITFLILCCQIILITQILSLLQAINGRNYLVATAIAFIASLLLAKNFKGALRSDFERLKLYGNEIYRLATTSKLFAVFLCGIFISVFWRIFLILYVPPNAWDSLYYHLSRIAFWLQHQSLGYFYTYHMPQVTFPFNAEIMCMWTMVASRADYVCGFIQFICYVLSGTVLYKCLRDYLKLERYPSATVVGVWYVLPGIVLQSVTALNDLVVAYFLMFCLVYFLLGISRRKDYLIVSALALAVAVGTKWTASFFLLPFAFLLILFLVMKIVRLTKLLIWGFSVVITWMIFGSYSYVQNYLMRHDLFVRDQFISFVTKSRSLGSFFHKLGMHAFNIAASQHGLHVYSERLSYYYTNIAAKMGTTAFRVLQIPMKFSDEPYTLQYHHGFDSWDMKFLLLNATALFGIVGLILLLLLGYIGVAGTVQLMKRKRIFNPRYCIFAFLFFGYLASLSHIIPWSPWSHRYMATMVLVGMPMLGMIATGRTRALRALHSGIIVYVIISLLPSTFMSRSKSLTDLYNTPRKLLRYSLDKWRLQTPIIMRFDSLVPLDTKVGVILPEHSFLWDYPLFGERLQRTILPLNLEIVQYETFDYIVAVDVALRHNKKLKKFIETHYVKKEILGRILTLDMAKIARACAHHQPQEYYEVTKKLYKPEPHTWVLYVPKRSEK